MSDKVIIIDERNVTHISIRTTAGIWLTECSSSYLIILCQRLFFYGINVNFITKSER